MEYIAIVSIVLIAAFVKGITGLGFSLITLPLLLLLGFSAKELIPVLMLCNLFASILIVLQKKDYLLIDKKGKNLIIYGALFTILGVIVLNKIPGKGLLIFLSIFFALISIFTFLKKDRKSKTFHIGIYRIAGATAGFITGCISISGPPLAIFLQHTHLNKTQFREIFAWFSITTAVVALIGYYYADMLTWKTLEYSSITIPLLFAGSYTGKRLNNKISKSFFEKMILALCIFSSIALLSKL